MDDEEVFVYMGEGGPVAPRDVVRARVHPSVTEIPPPAFNARSQLEELVLCEGLLEIKLAAFGCCYKLKRVNIPSTVRTLGKHVFSGCYALEDIELSEGIRKIRDGSFRGCRSLAHINLPSTITTIGECAFMGCQITNFRLPHLVTTLSKQVFSGCQSSFSVEISERIGKVGVCTFEGCVSLRNIAFSSNAQVWYNALDRCTDLQHLHLTDPVLINSLKHRFDNLPIHKMIYYQSYNNITRDKLNDAIDIRYSKRRSKLDPTGGQQDFLGMTPLHILACSTVQNIELYKVLIEKYSQNLIAKDRWGAIPLLYAVWGNAPGEIVQFLVESYKSNHPNNELNWTDMVKTLGGANVPLEEMKSLLVLKQESFPEQSIDWKQVIDELTKRDRFHYAFKVSEKVFRYVVKYSMAERISALGPRKWREDMACKLEESFSFDIESDDSCPKGWFIFVSSKLCEYEKEYINLKEATAMLELTLWNNKMAENFQEVDGHINKRAKIDEIGLRKECRINCGADIVIEHVLPYLL